MVSTSLGVRVLTLATHHSGISTSVEIITIFYVRDLFRFVGMVIGSIVGYFVYEYLGRPFWIGSGYLNFNSPDKEGTSSYQPSEKMLFSIIHSSIILILASNLVYEIGYMYLLIVMTVTIFAWGHFYIR